MPEGEFCTRCGAHREGGSLRLAQFALRPGEHVASPNVLSTLLPHLAHERLHAFRWGLLAGLVVVAILAATGLVVAAIWVAALLVPVLYILYLREADVYADTPLLVLAATVVAGGAVGAAVTAAGNALGSGLGAGGVVLLGVGIAIVAELLKPAGPLLLLRRRFPSTVDGLVLGVAAGLGYAFAQTLINLAGTFGHVGDRVAPSGWTFTLFSVGLLIPLLHGSCSGLVAASLWRPRGGRDAALRAAGLPLAIIADIGFTVGSELLDDARLSAFFVLLWQAVVVAAVLVAVRMLLHAAVLDEGTALGLREVRCHVCRRTAEAAAFCPHCGASLARGATRVGAVAASGR